MITTPAKQHKKHADLVRPAFGTFGRLELAVHGAPCAVIKDYTARWAASLSGEVKIAFADADHDISTGSGENFALAYTAGQNRQQVTYYTAPNNFDKHCIFNDVDLVILNGNHFYAERQIVIVHPDKPLANKLDKLTNVALVLRAPGQNLPDYIKQIVDESNISVLALTDDIGIANFLRDFAAVNIARVKGLVLAGGKSTRMQMDKGAIAYHGKSQRAHSSELLAGLVDDVFISGNDGDGFPVIADAFMGLGPFGGILSAMQSDPNAAWLTIACDLPYLSSNTLQYLLANRDPSKIATAFFDSDGKFPEPLVTVWEPRAYQRMLQFLSQGYSCPRKVLINSDIKLLTAPDVAEFRNINYPTERDEALRFFGGL